MATSYTIQVAMLTPLTSEGGLDHATLDHQLERLVGQEKMALSILGSTGEGAALPYALRSSLRDAVAARVRHQVPLFTGVLNTIPTDVRTELLSLDPSVFDGALVPPPFYYPMAPGEIHQYFWSLADLSPVPLMLYNIPPYTKISLPPVVVAELARHPNIMGIKDSSRDFEYFLSLLHHVEHGEKFKVLTGTDTLLSASLLAGGEGTVCAIANVIPGSIRALFDAITRTDYPEASRIQTRINELAYRVRNAGGVAAWKYLSRKLDGGTGLPLDPYSPLSSDSPVARNLDDLGDSFGLF